VPAEQPIRARIRRWLDDGDHRSIRPYTITRIEQSLDVVARRLAAAPEIAPGLVFDIGCGSAFDSFALADAVGETYGIDVDARAVAEGRLVAERAHVPEVLVDRAAVAVSHPPAPPSLVWCNIMSHNVPSRVDMLAHIASVTSAGALLMYAEASEGYALLELEHAVHARNAAAARARLRQAVAGASGTAAFRFFASGTAAPLLERLGFETLSVTAETAWRGVPVTERLWARRLNVAVAPPPQWDGDYMERVPWLARVREREAPLSGLEGVFETLDELATALRVSYSGTASIVRRALDRAPAPLSREPDWHRLDRIIDSWSTDVPPTAGAASP
jgi:SAM-dependent methyltransferase